MSDSNPMGSIFDQPEEDESELDAFSPMPHDPMHSALSSGLNWEQARVPGGQEAKSADVLDQPRGDNAPALPPSEEFLCCGVGPCKHYHMWLAEHDSLSDRLLTKVHRGCTGLGAELEVLDEGTCFACTSYAPPWWSISGMRRKIIVAHRIARANRLQAGRTKLSVLEQAFETIYDMVKGDAPELPRPPRQA